MNMKTELYIIDAFTDVPYKGNPAGVCLLKADAAEAEMQRIAAEVNLSETAFVRETADPDIYNIRYFTPAVEIAFCGHATLASAKALFTYKNKSKVLFNTIGGLKLGAEKTGKGILLKFPQFSTEEYILPEALIKAMGITASGFTGFSKQGGKFLIEVANKDVLAAVSPDFREMLKATDICSAVIVTCAGGDGEYDFYSRCFCPWVGINEDPVTGSAHSILGPYWKERLGKNKMKAYQLSARGGYLYLDVRDDGVLEVESNAVVVIEGNIDVPPAEKQ